MDLQKQLANAKVIKLDGRIVLRVPTLEEISRANRLVVDGLVLKDKHGYSQYEN